MKFDLVRPCKNCPFRCDIPGYLTRGRVEDLQKSLETATFACHKTVDYDRWEDGRESSDADAELGYGEYVYDGTEQHCAGALILQEKTGAVSQMAQIAERLGLRDPSRLDLSAPVYDSWDAMKEAMSE